jgi:hypothetical protein
VKRALGFSLGQDMNSPCLRQGHGCDLLLSSRLHHKAVIIFPISKKNKLKMKALRQSIKDF